MTSDGKKIFLMISPNFPACYYKFAKELKKRNFVVIGLGDAFPNEIRPELHDVLAEYFQCYDLISLSSAIQTIQKIIDKYGPIDFLESNNEYWLEHDSTLRQWFNIKTGLFHDQIMKYKAKSLMKEYFIKGGAQVAKWHISDNFETTKAWANEIGYPIFVKPNIGVGSIGTKKIHNEEELKDFYNKYDKKEYIFEQFVDGDTVSYDGITNSNGEIIFENSEVFLVDNEKIVNEDADDAYYTCKEIPEDLKILGRNVVHAFDIRKRCFHIEFFRLKNDCALGKKHSLVALEVNLRPAGGFTPDIISYSQNVSMYAIYADMIAFDKNLQPLPEKKYYAVTAGRKDRFTYAYTKSDIIQHFESSLLEYGEYPKEISDDMGNSFYIGRFDTLDECNLFIDYILKKVNVS